MVDASAVAQSKAAVPPPPEVPIGWNGLLLLGLLDRSHIPSYTGVKAFDRLPKEGKKEKEIRFLVNFRAALIIND